MEIFNIDTMGDPIVGGKSNTMLADMNKSVHDWRQRWSKGKSRHSTYRENNKERLNQLARERYHRNKNKAA